MPSQRTKRSSRRGVDVPYEARLGQLRRRMREAGATAMLVTNPVDIRYLTGFVGDDSWALIGVRGGRVVILSDSRFEEQIQREAPGARRVMRGNLRLDEVLAKVVGKRQGKIAVQPDHVSLSVRRRLVKAIGGRRLLEIEDGLLEQRSVKDAGEIAAIRKALKIQERAFLNTLAFIKPGMSERRIAGYLEYQMRELGADGRSFQSIVAVGANASLPHAIPGGARARRNEIILIDWGAKVDGYCSDLTRVAALGRMPGKIREIYEVVLEAQLAGIAAIRPGERCEVVDAAARRVIEQAGYGKHFGHGLGHGVGLDIHESPRLGQTRRMNWWWVRW